MDATEPNHEDPIARAIAELRLGRFVVVVDDEDRENEGDLIIAAEYMTAADMAFMIRYTSGLICVGMDGSRIDQLRLPPMVTAADDPRGTAFTVSVDLKDAASTGISASDRANTVRALADPAVPAETFSRPGHVFPLRARPGGVLQRAGHTESAVDLCRLAGLHPAGALAEITNDDGTMARRPQLEAFARRHDLVVVSVADIVRHRLRTESLVQRIATGQVPTPHGDFSVTTYRASTDGTEHVVAVHGDISTGENILVRVHSECLTGDVFGSRRCDCGEQLELALAEIGAAGAGVVVYLRGHEGRGIGLGHKLPAYELQDRGLDTVDANLALGFPVDTREYGIGAQILRDMGIRSIRLMTNNPAKYHGLHGHGITITQRVPVSVRPNAHNRRYITAKSQRLGHLIDVPENNELAAESLREYS